MKILTQGKELSLVSENESERTALAVFFATNSAKSSEEVIVTGKPARKPHKKHAFKKECVDCPGRTFKGAKGLAKHRTSMHRRVTPAGMSHLPVHAG